MFSSSPHIQSAWQAIILIVIGWPFLLCSQNNYINTQLPEPNIFPHPDFEWISEIKQERNGILWLATNRGLFSFDGAEFRRKPHQPNGFSAVDNNGINDLLLDQEKKQLWVAHEMGASMLDLQTDSFTNFTFYQNNPDGLVDGACESVFKDRQGIMWFGVLGFGLARLDTSLHFFHMPNVFGDEALQSFYSIHQIVQDVQKDSILWLASGLGLVRFNKETSQYDFLTHPKAENRPEESILTCLLPTRDKIFCGNTWGEGACFFDLDTQVFKKIEVTSSNKRIEFGAFQAISEEVVGCYSNIGYIFIDQTNGTFISSVTFPKKLKLIGDGFLASPHQIWQGTRDGLAMFDMSTYHVENHVIPRDENFWPSFLISVLEKNNKNGLWLGFQNTDYIYDYNRSNRSFRQLSLPEGKGATVQFLRLLDDREIFVSTRGVIEIDEDHLKRLPISNHFTTQNIDIRNPAQDRKGNLWLSSRWDGLYQVDLNTGKYENVLSDSPFSAAVLIFKDSRDNIYISGNGFQVYQPDLDTVLHLAYQPGDSLTIRYPRGYVEVGEGYIWMSSTRVGGLLKIHPDSLEKGILEKYDAYNGPNSNQMRSLAKDQRGRIWAVTYAGLQVFDPVRETFQLFGEEAGFRLREPIHGWPNFNPSYLTSLSTGEMLVGYVDGFAIFHPDSLRDNEELPKPYFLSILVNDKPLPFAKIKGNDDFINFAHNENLIEFHYSCIAFREPDKVSYRYRLVGFDQDWFTTVHRQVRFTHLPPGKYTFNLQAINSDGHHSSSSLQWHFNILPPWWATWWAYCLYLILVGGILYIFYRLQLQRRLAEAEAQRLLEQFSNNGWFRLMQNDNLQFHDDFLKKLNKALEDNYADENFDIPQLCEAMHLSRAQLYRKVKTLTGKPVGQVLRSYRMQRARTLLEATDLSVSQVALEVGFKQLAHFSRTFQQEFGANPSVMRKRDNGAKD